MVFSPVFMKDTGCILKNTRLLVFGFGLWSGQQRHRGAEVERITFWQLKSLQTVSN